MSALPARALPLLAAASLALGLSGCADGEVQRTNAYVERVNAAQARFAEVSEELLARVRPDEPSAANDRLLARFGREVDALAERLSAIDPPARVRALHRRLATAMARYGRQVRAAGRDIASDDASRILDGQSDLVDATKGVSRSVNRAIAAINAVLQP